jgi:CheY-like chemotaxis protein
VTLRLHARPTGDPQRLLLILEIEDTGVGIAAGDQARIFEPFVQVGKLTTQKGTGLGLAITRQYVELMGGQISVESALGQGSKFRVELPVGRADAPALSAAEIRHGRVVGLAPDQPEYRVLIVEDQMENWLLLQRLLEDVGFQVRVGENGAVGVEMFRLWLPHFIFMDIRMPVMDGLEATQRIRALEGGREVKIAALTASVFKEERANVMAVGMDDFVRKPYRAEEILDCLARHLGARYVYEQAPAAAAEERTATLRPEALAALSPELRGELSDALVSLDVARIAELIRRVSALDPALGDALADHASQLGYGAILKALQAGDGDAAKEAV